mmetsp:Transcript_109214/g.216879  ORF Transcript_109214/g.216879 Transcript_109214/m.216879 type:complete len:120 (+) Transcript_109214:90-449(+)
MAPRNLCHQCQKLRVAPCMHRLRWPFGAPAQKALEGMVKQEGGELLADNAFGPAQVTTSGLSLEESRPQENREQFQISASLRLVLAEQCLPDRFLLRSPAYSDRNRCQGNEAPGKNAPL